MTARSESGDRLELQRVELFHLRLLLHTHVRVQLKTEVEKSDACGVQPVGPPTEHTEWT